MYTETYDLGIIGGGIAGAAVARDAVLRGLSVVLFEKNTFGSGTSSKSSKLIHGGIRYLELAWNALTRGHFKTAWKNLHFVFASLRESRILRRIAPGLVRPLPLLVPIYDSDRRSPFMVTAGCALYFLLALFSGGARPPVIYLGKKAALRALPNLNPEGLVGAVKIWEHYVDDRALVVATIESAKKSGAHCLEKTAVTGYTLEENLHTAVEVSGSTVHGAFHVRRLIDATGPWIDKTRELGGERNKDYVFPIAGSHIELPAFLPISTLLQAKDGRFFFVIIHGNRARVGTTERVVENPEGVQPTDKEIDYLMASLNHYFPTTDLKKSDILSKDAGVRPLPASDEALDPNQISREHELRLGAYGCLHLLGVKLTDHRRAAEKAVDHVLPDILRERPGLRQKTRTHRLPL